MIEFKNNQIHTVLCICVFLYHNRIYQEKVTYATHHIHWIGNIEKHSFSPKVSDYFNWERL